MLLVGVNTAFSLLNFYWSRDIESKTPAFFLCSRGEGPHEKVRGLVFHNCYYLQTLVHEPPKRMLRYDVSSALFKNDSYSFAL